MANEQPEGSKQYTVVVKLNDGESLEAPLGEDPEQARSELVSLYRRLASEPFVLLGDQLLVRSADVRYARLHDEDQAGGGLIESLRQKIGGGQEMSGHEFEGQQAGGMQGGGGGATAYQGGGEARAYGSQGAGGRGGSGPAVADYIGYGRRPYAETKPFFLTSEFLVLVLLILLVLGASAVSDDLPQRLAWILVTALGGAYMLSRGIAKAGSREPNPMMNRRGGY